MLSGFMIARDFTRLLIALVMVSAVAACQKVPLLAPSGSTITLTSSNTALPLGGSTTILAQVIEASGNPPHQGTQVTFTTTLGSIQPTNVETDINGQAYVTFAAGSQSGTATVTALSGGASVGTNGAIKIAVGTAAVGRVVVSANPASVSQLGGAATITANVVDLNGNVLPNAPVNFTTTAGTLSSSVVNTDQNGNAQTVLTTSQQATVTASVGAQGGSSAGGTGTTTPGTGTTGTTTTTGTASGSVTVTVTASPTLVITPPTTAPSVGLPASFTFAVTAATTNGVAVRNVSVNWGDGTSQNLGAITGNAVVSHTYQDTGTYFVTATVTDATGQTQTYGTSVTVVATASPTINITPPNVPSPVTYPYTANFTVQVTPPSGVGVVDATVDYGDGVHTQDLGGLNGSATLSNRYATSGTYRVTVTVKDTLGRSTTGTATINLP